MKRDVKPLCLLFFTLLCLVTTASFADPVWPRNTGGQQQLAALVERLNENLVSVGEQPVNSLFAAYKTGADFGITDQPDGEIPEGTEFHAELYATTLNTLTLRVNDPERFAKIAGCLLKAVAPEQYPDGGAMTVPKQKAAAAEKAPLDSFEEPVTELNGTVIRTYYAYYPDQYHDGNSWLQLTVVFPIEGYEDVSWKVINDPQATRGPDTYSDHSEDYEGYDSKDSYTHLEIFATATPEPDSAAGGWLFDPESE